MELLFPFQFMFQYLLGLFYTLYLYFETISPGKWKNHQFSSLYRRNSLSEFRTYKATSSVKRLNYKLIPQIPPSFGYYLQSI